ncbi:hypothetical protein GCM10023153_32620 [Ornithinibacter aureus]|uniref:Uncharacterized protein n=1 Tax=Ornithinibacter aureus TaxID=622664 RepID=A0ABP8K9Z4_9MICO|nr:hypothetical protein [Ornithinibacter aureus]KAF0835201.1 hypothetical protein C8E84_3078 [Ornithinibacter aureus]
MRRHLTTAAFSLAGLSWTLGQGVLPDMGTDTDSRYDAVAAAPTLESLSAALLVLAGVFLVLGSMAAVHRLAAWTGTTGRRLMLAGTALTGLGGLWLVGGRAAFNLMFVRLVETESLSRGTAIALLESSGGTGFVPLVLMLPCLLLGPVLLAVGLKRSGLAGWLPLAAWVIGIAAFIGTEFQIKAAETAGIAFASVGLALAGRALDTAPASSLDPRTNDSGNDALVAQTTSDMQL